MLAVPSVNCKNEFKLIDVNYGQGEDFNRLECTLFCVFSHENFANHLMFLSEKLTYSHQQHTFFFKNDFLNQKCVQNCICKDGHQIGSFIMENTWKQI